jgi:hypothetical protein
LRPLFFPPQLGAAGFFGHATRANFYSEDFNSIILNEISAEHAKLQAWSVDELKLGISTDPSETALYRRSLYWHEFYGMQLIDEAAALLFEESYQGGIRECVQKP